MSFFEDVFGWGKGRLGYDPFARFVQSAEDYNAKLLKFGAAAVGMLGVGIAPYLLPSAKVGGLSGFYDGVVSTSRFAGVSKLLQPFLYGSAFGWGAYGVPFIGHALVQHGLISDTNREESELYRKNLELQNQWFAENTRLQSDLYAENVRLQAGLKAEGNEENVALWAGLAGLQHDFAMQYEAFKQYGYEQQRQGQADYSAQQDYYKSMSDYYRQKGSYDAYYAGDYSGDIDFYAEASQLMSGYAFLG